MFVLNLDQTIFPCWCC